MQQRMAAFVLATMLGASAAHADETTFCNTYITSLPYTILVQGHYCFDRNLSTAITTGSAITINADFVVLDLNNFKLGGGGAGLATNTIGILANGRRNVTVRNGNIRGFRMGISLVGSTATSGGHVIENNVLDANTYIGLNVAADTFIARNNFVSNTGGNTAGTAPFGIAAYHTYTGHVVLVRDNLVTNVFGGDYPTGISTVGGGQSIDRNVVKMGGAGTNRICIHSDGGYLRDNLCLGHSRPELGFLHAEALIVGNHQDP